MRLPRPARYLPFLGGKYSITPDLAPLGRDFGNGDSEGKLFQFDTDWERYQRNGKEASQQHPERHVLFDDFSPAVADAVLQLMVERLQTEWTDIPLPDSPTFTTLCETVQEDIAVVRWTPERGEWNAAMHITTPSHWAPEEKIGKGYADTHAPVPGMEKQRSNATNLAQVMRTRGPFVRFTWGISFSDALNCHPKIPKAAFDPANLWIRVERQTLHPLPEVDAFLFAIRLYLYPLAALSHEEKDALLLALDSMSEESRAYKGISSHYTAIIEAIQGR
jgi:dimethylamine monooxygenase subunit A